MKTLRKKTLKRLKMNRTELVATKFFEDFWGLCKEYVTGLDPVIIYATLGLDPVSSGPPRGCQLEHYADKMIAILPKIGWLLLLYLVCVLCQSA